MKYIYTILSLIGTINAGAFTLDFVGRTGTTLPPSPLVVNVIGYGDVSFTPSVGSALEVGNQYGTIIGSTIPSLEIDSDEALIVTFLGANPIGVDFDIVGYGLGETLGLVQLNASSFVVSIQGGDGVGLQSISFGAVPEPSSAMLAALGVFGFVLRRRR